MHHMLLYGLVDGSQFVKPYVRSQKAQIITALKQVEAGRTAENVAREQGVSKPIIYAWKAKYGGMALPSATSIQPPRWLHTIRRASFLRLSLYRWPGNDAY
jgi:hypothetical protein